MDHEIEVSVTYLEVKGCVILAHYNKVRYSYISKSSKNKTKSLDQEIQVTVTYILGQMLCHTESLCQSLTFIHQIVFKI